MVGRTSLRVVTLLALAGAACWWTGASAYLKYGVRVGTRQVSLRWQSMPVRYLVNDRVPAPLSSAEVEASIAQAFGTWAAVSEATVAAQYVGRTSAAPVSQDGATVLGFADRPDLDRVLGATTFVVDASTGALVESDIFFNAAFPWSTASAGEAGRFDLPSIALHEVGHLLGLGHSALGETELRPSGGRRVIASGAAMFPIAFSAGSVAGRALQADDVAGLRDLYDRAGRGSGRGSISGRVTRGGAGVFGAHVVAFSPETGQMVGNFTLTADGTFAIAGLDPGAYVVRVEPLDDADLNAFFGDEAGVDVGFRVTYLDRLALVPAGGNAGPFEIKVAAR